MGLNAEHKPMMLSNRASFLVAGFCIAAWAPMIPFVKERFGLDEHNLGLLLLCVGIGSFVSMPTSGYFGVKFGCRTPIYVSAFVVAVCLICIPFIDNIYLLGVVLFCMGISAVALDVISNINAALVEHVANRNVMSGLHGLYSVGGFLGATSVTFLLSLGMPLHWTGLYAAVVIVALILLGGRHLFTTVYVDEIDGKEKPEAKTESATEAPKKESHLKYYLHPTVLPIGLTYFILFMTAVTLRDWSGFLLRMVRRVRL